MAIVRIREDTLPDCTRVADTQAVCKEVAGMMSVFTGVAEMLTDSNRLAGTPLLAKKKRSDLMTTSKRESLEVVRSNMASAFNKDST